MIKSIVITLVNLLFINSLIAQSKIYGTVKGNKNKNLIAASITIVGTYDGTITDSLGKYKITTYEKGQFTVEVKCLGYKTTTQPLYLDNKNVEINFILKEEINELSAVTVTAGSFEAGDKKRTATVLTALDVYTTGGANGDITSAIKTLPGTQQVGEQEGLFVRGGAGYETKQMIDGLVVNNPFFSGAPDIATRGRFSPSLFKGNVFSTGGYSALYGQALSSVLLLESIDMPERSEASASITSVFAGAGFQHLAKNKKSSIGINYGYTNLQPYFSVVKQKQTFSIFPTYQNVEANFRIKTKRNGMIKFYSSFSDGKMGLRTIDIDSVTLKNQFELRNNNWYNIITYKENLGKGWKLNTGISFSTNTDKINNKVIDNNNQPTITGKIYIDSKNFILRTKQELTVLRAVAEKRIKGISVVRFGTEYWFANNEYSFNGFKTNFKDRFTSLFAEADIYLTNNLAFKAGSRFENSSLINKNNISPRLSLAYKLGNKGQMSVAYGTFFQKPELDQIMQYNNTVINTGFNKATHYLINYIKNTSLQTFRVEAFYKKYNNLIKTFPDTTVNGNGYAKGFEIFWRDKKTIKFIDYWISYSYLDTKRDFLNYPSTLQPSFATPHTLSIVTKTFILKWKTGFNLTYNFATGRPYYNIVYNNNLSKYEILDEGKTIDYHNLGFSLNYLPNLGKKNAKTFIVLVASVTNVLNSNQIYSYRYSYNNLNKVAVTPTAKQFYFIGCFLSWGVDKTQDAINNNL
ncbi:MAG TPA: TonB-dependent receptor [Chitinophagaceae bacterium]|nr:TonB-dependent receptor [Chitinophagaceae bacterium]HNL81886.1 TonB-dependent receptor [Chitinophagaceae bacterium]HNM34567.1 TonB-dependent receptor [Chitinophagaceae bacterium]